MNFSFQIIREEQNNKQIIELREEQNKETGTSSPIQKSRKQKKKMQKPKSTYNWKEAQNRKYILFLVRERWIFDLNNREKKSMKVNVRMSFSIQSRNAAQCHSHHQKMLAKYGCVDRIISVHKKLINFKSIPKAQKNFLKSITDPPTRNFLDQQKSNVWNLENSTQSLSDELFPTKSQQNNQLSPQIDDAAFEHL